jgi:RecB family exonuclease
MTPIHPTEKETFQRCPAAWHYEYELQIPAPYHTWAKVRGCILHEIFKLGLEYFDQIYTGTIAFYEKNGDDIWFRPKDMDKEYASIREQAEGFFRYMHEHEIITLYTEKTFQFNIKGIDHEGTLDRICRHPDTPEGMVEIHDYKTGNKWSKDSIDRKVQFFDYYLAAEQNGFKINRVFWGHTKDLNRFKTNCKSGNKGDFKGPFLYPIVITPGDTDFLTENTERIVKAMRTGAWFYNSVGPNAPCDMCPYAYGTCPRLEKGLQEDTTDWQAVQKQLEAEYLQDNGE